MKNKGKHHDVKITLIPWTICAALYCGLLILEGFFFGGDVKVSVYTFYAGFVVLAGAYIIYFLFPGIKYKSVIACAATQVMFITVGAYLHELDFYFFMLLLLVGIVSISKNFMMMALYLTFSVTANVLILIFLVPHLDWLNHFRFFMQFMMFLYGSVFMLVQTFSVTQRETGAEKAFSAFSSLLNSTPNYMVIVDSEKRVRYISQPMVEFARYVA